MSSSDVERIPATIYAFEHTVQKPLGVWKPQTLKVKPKPDLVDGPIPLRILTYNVWFDAIHKKFRSQAIMKLIQEEDPDVCCLQEMTKEFEKLLKESSYWKKNYMMTSLKEQWGITNSWYGTMIMVKKATLVNLGLMPSAYFVDFRGSITGRCLTVLELSSAKAEGPTILISTAHLDYTPVLRKAQFKTSIKTLASARSSKPVDAGILSGDTNIQSYDEVDILLEAGFIDSWIAANTAEDDKADRFHEGATFGDAGVQFRETAGKTQKPKEKPRRLDLIMARNFEVKASKIVGDKPFWESNVNHEGTVVVYDVYPSDHKGVISELEWSRQESSALAGEDGNVVNFMDEEIGEAV